MRVCTVVGTVVSTEHHLALGGKKILVVDDGDGNPNMHGGFDSSNQFYVDGVNNTDPLTGTFSQNMNFDAIQEIQVITGGMDAEYGRSLGDQLHTLVRD